MKFFSLALVVTGLTSTVLGDHVLNSARLHRRQYGDSSYSYGSSSKDTAAMHQDPAPAAAPKSIDAHASKSTDAHATMSSSMPSYGSGSNSGSYDSCVQTCQAEWGMHSAGGSGGGGYSSSWSKDGAKATMTTTAYSSSATGGYGSSGMGHVSPMMGNGSMMGNASAMPLVASSPWEVIVAPMKGDLRMVPFNINPPIGQMITYIWGAGPHTVTESDNKSICNKSTTPGAFASGMQNATFKYEVKINDTSTKIYFCGVPTHCQKGMFGLINGAVTTDPLKMFGGWGKKMAMNDTAFGKQWNSTMEKCNGTDAWQWGNSLDMSVMPEWAQPMAAYSVLATREYYAANPKLLVAISNGTNSTLGSNGTTSTNGTTSVDGGSASTSPADLTSPDSSSTASPGSLKGIASSSNSLNINRRSLLFVSSLVIACSTLV